MRFSAFQRSESLQNKLLQPLDASVCLHHHHHQPPVDEDVDEVEYEDEVHPLGWYMAEELAHSGSHHSDQDAGVASSAPQPALTGHLLN